MRGINDYCVAHKCLKCSLAQIPDRCKNHIVVSGCDIVCIKIDVKTKCLF